MDPQKDKQLAIGVNTGHETKETPRTDELLRLSEKS
jgi:hypothetical protein